MTDHVINSGLVDSNRISQLNAVNGDTLTINGSATFPNNCEYLFNNAPFTTINIEISTSNVTIMAWMFGSMPNIENINLGSNFDTSNVTDMSFMFWGNDKIQYLDLGSKFSTAKVTSMVEMFTNTTALKFVGYEKNNTARFIKDGSLSQTLTPHNDSPLGSEFWYYGTPKTPFSKPKKIILKQGSNVINYTFTPKTKMIVKYGHLGHPIAHQITKNTRMIVKEANGTIKSVPLL